MDIQTIFYTLGSILMILFIIIAVGIAVLVWTGYKAVKKTQENIQSATENLPEKIVQYIASKPSLLAGGIGMTLSTLIMKKIKNMISRK